MTPEQEKIIQDHIKMRLEEKWYSWDKFYRESAVKEEPTLKSVTDDFFDFIESETKGIKKNLAMRKLSSWERYCKANEITDEKEIQFVKDVDDKIGFAYEIYNGVIRGLYRNAKELCDAVREEFELPEYGAGAEKQTSGWMTGICGDGERALRTIFCAKRNIERNSI